MSIAPVIKSVSVKAPPARAFEAFTASMTAWWPKTHTIGAAPFETVVIEPRAGGRWFERAANGAETNWGKVLEWEPPSRFVLAWQISGQWAYDPNLITEVEVNFADQGDGTTRVTLEHRHLERFGVDAEKLADQFGNGWQPIIEQFATYLAS